MVPIAVALTLWAVCGPALASAPTPRTAQAVPARLTAPGMLPTAAVAEPGLRAEVSRNAHSRTALVAPEEPRLSTLQATPTVFHWAAGIFAIAALPILRYLHSVSKRRPAEPLSALAIAGGMSRRDFQTGALALGVVLPAWAAASPPAAALPATPSPVPSVPLGSLTISRLIQGHWQLAGGHGKEPLEDPFGNMHNHLNAGIYTFDTADIYGASQELIGEYLKTDKPQGAVVCTKFCCFNNLDRIGRDAVRRGIQRSLDKLGVRQLDLVAFFWSDFNVKNYVQTALYLKELKDEGLIKEIGVTNFDVVHLAELVDAGIPVVSNQVQYSLMDRRPENGMLEYCNSHGIKVIAFGTVCGGYLSSKYLGQPPGQITNYSQSLYSTSINKAGGWTYLQELLKTLDEVATKHQVTIANVAARWVLQQPGVAAAIVGVRNSTHIEENIRVFAFELDDEDLRRIAVVLAKEIPPKGDIWFRERGLV
jgi:aryl-alcohol dehydrogenase-like predicted oxidoreductase